jgi:Na+/H+ antiporter NhaD/arsenite permease-like protein
MTTAAWMTAAVFALTYLGLAVGKVPWLRMDRAGIALVGATLMLVFGLLTVDEAVGRDSIDYPTLMLLFGMMVVVGFLRLSGFLRRLTAGALDRVRSPLGLLAATVALAGVLSAFLINDVVCLALTPLVLHVARRRRFDPVPHLIGLATAANIGSAGTITGNPQNIFIGAHSHIPYLRFAAKLTPVAALGLVLAFLAIACLYRRRLAAAADAKARAAAGPGPPPAAAPPPRRAQLVLQYKSAAVAAAAVVLFFTGLPLDLIALGAASVLLLGRVKPEKVYREVDWGLLMMFAGLFVVVHAFRVHVVDS